MTDNDTSTTCLFCEIAAGREPAHIVHENERLLAFLVLRPIRPGHLLIMPRRHFAYFDDMPAELAAETMHLGQRIARAQKAIYGVERVGFLYSGADIAHVHAHVLPLFEKTDLTSRRYIVEEHLTFREGPRTPTAELAAVADDIRQALAG